MTTLDDALSGAVRGIEVPIQCPSPTHEDSTASASVNVLKMVWYCYACHASGAAEGTKAPAIADLQAMMEPEQAVRVYPESYLSLFDVSERLEEVAPAYWHTRFPRWVCHVANMGSDPFTGQATFPVRTPQGLLAGVGRRLTDAQVEEAKSAGTNPSRYKYPYRWSASTVLHGADYVERTDHVVLVEGAADQVSLCEVGIPALGTYGSGLHYPQVEMLLRRSPNVVVLGFDDDKAGRDAVERSARLLTELDVDINIVVVAWPRNDPAACMPEERLEAVSEAVGGDLYRAQWSKRAGAYQARYATSITSR